MSNPHISLNFNLVAHKREEPTPLSSRVLHVVIATVAAAIFYKCTGFNNFKNFRQIAQFIGGSALIGIANKALPIAEIAQEILGTKIDTTIARLEVTPREQPGQQEGAATPSNLVGNLGLEVKPGKALSTPKEQEFIQGLTRTQQNAYRRAILSKKTELLARATVLEKPPAYIEGISRIALFCLSAVGAVFIYKHTLGHISTKIQAWRYTLCDHFLYQTATMFSLLPMQEMQATMQPFDMGNMPTNSVIELEAFLSQEELNSLSIFAKKRKIEALSAAVQEMLEPIQQQVKNERFVVQNRVWEEPVREEPGFFDPLLAWLRASPEIPAAPAQTAGEGVFAPSLETIFQQLDDLLPQEKALKKTLRGKLKADRQARKSTEEHIAHLQGQIGRGNNVPALVQQLAEAKELLKSKNQPLEDAKIALAQKQNEVHAARGRVAAFNEQQKLGVPRPLHPGIELPSLSCSYVLRTAAKISLVVASVYFLQMGYPLLAFSIPQAIKASFNKKYIYPAIEYLLVQMAFDYTIGNLASAFYDQTKKVIGKN